VKKIFKEGNDCFNFRLICALLQLFGRLDSVNNKPHWKLTEELIEETMKVVQGTCILFGT
jgi:hypothetical protein